MSTWPGHPIIVDIETAPHPCAAEFLGPLNLDAITAAKNLKDPAKIAEDIQRRKADAAAEHAAKLDKAALDWNVSRIVAIGYSTGGDIIAKPCRTEDEERDALASFWMDAKGRDILGYRARTFDVPTLVQRSRLLNVPHRTPNLARFGRGSVIDLFDVLTFDDSRAELVMPRRLKTFCKRFGLVVSDDVDGKDVPALIAEGNWDAVIAHVTSDVRLTIALAQRVGVLASVETFLAEVL